MLVCSAGAESISVRHEAGDRPSKEGTAHETIEGPIGTELGTIAIVKKARMRDKKKVLINAQGGQ
jgi:hypothetical protein